MKHTLICFLLAAGLLACGEEKQKDQAAQASENTSLTAADTAAQTLVVDSLQVDIQQKAQEIDDLLRGI